MGESGSSSPDAEEAKESDGPRIVLLSGCEMGVTAGTGDAPEISSEVVSSMADNAELRLSASSTSSEVGVGP